MLADALAALRRADTGQARVGRPFSTALLGNHRRRAHAQFYRHVEGKTRLNRPYTINGDQGLLISRAFFDQLGRLRRKPVVSRRPAHRREDFRAGPMDVAARRTRHLRRAALITEGHTPSATPLMALIMGLYAGGATEFLSQPAADLCESFRNRPARPAAVSFGN